MRRARPLLLAAFLLLTGGLVAAPASALPSGVYSLPYTDTLYRHWHFNDSSTYTYELVFEEWRRSGFLAPVPGPVEYVTYAWSPTIYAVSFFGPNREDWIWEQLSFDQWARAGYPQPRTAGWIENSTFYQWPTSDEVFVEAWDGSRHRLTYPEWLAAGAPGPSVQWGEGFYRYSWSPSIGYVWDTSTGEGYPLTFEDWQSEGFPTPQTVAHIAGEEVYRYSESPVLYLDSPITGYGLQLTAEMWAALGYPEPVVY